MKQVTISTYINIVDQTTTLVTKGAFMMEEELCL